MDQLPFWSRLAPNLVPLLSTADISVLCRTNNTLRAYAEPFLYRSIPLFTTHPRLVRFCRTIIERPPATAARLVREICLGEPHDSDDAPALPYLISAALAKMSELDTLILDFYSHEDVLLRFCPFGRLRVFSCVRVWDALPRFLAHQPSIEHLFLTGADNPALYLPPHSLPNLRHFTGTGSVAASIIPGRPVTTIQVTSTPYPLSVILPRVARSTGPTQTLVLYLHGDLNVLDCVRNVSRSFPDLKELVIHHGARDLPTLAIASELRQCAFLEILKTIEVEPMDSITLQDLEVEHSTVTQYRQCCPALLEVVVHAITWRLADDRQFIPLAENRQISDAWSEHCARPSGTPDHFGDVDLDVSSHTEASSGDLETLLGEDSYPRQLKKLADLHLDEGSTSEALLEDDDMDNSLEDATGRSLIPASAATIVLRSGFPMTT